MFGGGGGGRRERGPKKAKGMLKELEISLEDVYNGGMRNFPHKRYRCCESCDGKGGSKIDICDGCNGQGMVRKMVMLGPGMYSQSMQHCGQCGGKGKSISKKHLCKKCKGEKIVMTNKKIEVPIQKGVPHEYDYIMTGEAHEGVQRISLSPDLLSPGSWLAISTSA